MKNRKQNSLARIVVISAIFSILFMAYFTTGGQVFAQDASVGETIVCLGDSGTAGNGATVVGKDNKSKSWPAFLQNKVNIPVINAGVSGNTTAQGLARIKKDVLSKNPSIVIIQLATNDIMQKIPMSTTINNLQKIFDMLNDGKRKIYFMIPDKKSTDSGVLAQYKGLWQQYEDVVYPLLSSNNIETIYHGDGVFGVKGNMSTDNIHPNAKGYEIIAEQVFNALKPYLEANNLLKE